VWLYISVSNFTCWKIAECTEHLSQKQEGERKVGSYKGKKKRKRKKAHVE
jgi:hypothetical protein